MANKRVSLMAYAITLLRKDGKLALNSLRLYITGLETVCRSRQTTKYAWRILALCKASLCAGRRTRKTQNKKQRTPFGVLCFLWSGLRGSNPPPSPWQGDALPNELNPHINGASGRNRTNDTGIFSPLLYQLSYRGICLPFL